MMNPQDFIYFVAILTAGWAAWQDIKHKSIDGRAVLALTLIIILGIYIHGWAGFKALAISLAIGWLFWFTLGWQLGDTLILAALSTATLHPFAITVAAVSTSFFFALAEAREKGKGATIPYAPFLLLGALISLIAMR